MNVIIFGMGPIGKDLLKKSVQNPNIEVIGVVDINPNHVGKDAALLIDMEPIEIYVVEHISDIEVNTNAVVLHAAGSTLATAKEQFETILNHGYSIVSTCEELLYPWEDNKEIANILDQLAKKQNRFIVGTGINPGFLMDSLPLFLTAITSQIKNVLITRVVDAGLRRLPLQQKVGVGLTVSQFEQKKAQNNIGHVGLRESLQLFAEGIGYSGGHITHNLEPVLSSEKTIDEEQQVNGIHETISTRDQADHSITLDLTMALHQFSRDEILIETEEEQNLHVVFPDGVFGDSTTTNMVLNTAKTLSISNKSGMLTMTDIPLVRNSNISTYNKHPNL